MVEVYFVIDTWSQNFYHTWFCDRCQIVVKTKYVGRGFKGSFPSCPDSVFSPIKCSECGNLTTRHERSAETIWRRTDTGEEFVNITSKPGACYNELSGIFDPFTKQLLFGKDKRALRVVAPNGKIWSIDGRAPDCSMRHDVKHKCWHRTGSPDRNTLSVEIGGPCRNGDPTFVVGDFWGTLIHGKLKAY